MGKVLRFHILLVLAGAADRYVDIRPQVAVLHVAITGAQIAQDLAQLDHIGGRLFGAANVRARHNFHQRHTGAVQIDKGHCRVKVVNGFASVLFHVNAFHPHPPRNARFHVDNDLSFAHKWLI